MATLAQSDTPGSAVRFFDAAERYQAALADAGEILELAADACRTPMAALKVADDAGCHFAATLGMPSHISVPKALSLCGMVSVDDDAMIVDDATRDPRLTHHPLVCGDTHVRFLAAAPLHLSGHVVGALCVFDSEPREGELATTRRILARLARRIDSETDLRDRASRRESLQDAVEDHEVVASISHEIRTPLAAIRGNLEMLTETPGAINPAYARQIDAIARNASRLTRTVDNLLWAVDPQRQESVDEHGRVDATGVVQSLVNRLGVAPGRVLLDLPRKPVWVTADASMLETALQHLLSNALSFSASGEPVRVMVADTPYPFVSVIDKGPGMDEAELGRLGIAFYRGEHARDNQLPGLGLGLSITRRIVEALGGQLRMHSARGRGTTAQIAFPEG